MVMLPSCCSITRPPYLALLFASDTLAATYPYDMNQILFLFSCRNKGQKARKQTHPCNRSSYSKSFADGHNPVRVCPWCISSFSNPQHLVGRKPLHPAVLPLKLRRIFTAQNDQGSLRAETYSQHELILEPQTFLLHQLTSQTLFISTRSHWRSRPRAVALSTDN